VAAAHASGPHPPKPKRSYALHISIDDGHSSVRQGDRLTYTTKISNSGAAATPALRITQTLTPDVTFVSATPKGEASADRIQWSGSLSAGKTVQYTVTVQVGRLAPQLQRLAAVACASSMADDRPIVCATHLDRLPVPEAIQSSSPGVGARWLMVSAIVAALLALGVLVRRRVLRHRARTGSVPPGAR
jgi:uncharacterized repeat protein (TIGR01451 family)